MHVTRLRLAREDAARCAEQPVHLVEVVDHQIDSSPSGLLPVAEPVGPVRRRGEPQGRDRAGPTELARLDDARELDVLRPEPQHEADHQHPAAPLGRREDRVCVVERERERLLDEDMLPRREGALGDLAMERGRHADVDRLDLRVGEDRVEVDRRLGAHGRGDTGGPLGAGVRRTAFTRRGPRAQRSSRRVPSP